MVVVAEADDVAGCHTTNTMLSEAASRRRRRKRLRESYSRIHTAQHDFANGKSEDCMTPPHGPHSVWKDFTPEKGSGNVTTNTRQQFARCGLFDAVHQNLNDVMADLCSKLYEPDAVDAPKCAEQVSFDSALALALGQALASNDGLTDIDSESYEPDPSVKDLATISDTIGIALSHLKDASQLAAVAEARCAKNNMNVNEYFLELYYSRMDPAGVQEQLLEDAELEQELHNLSKNLAGHLYTFARHRFWKLIGDIPDDLRRRLVEFGLAHAVVDGAFAELSQADYEHLFNIPDQGAFAWQEE